MVRGVVLEGRPPPVCAANSHQEKASGSSAVPAPGVPQATVAVADTAVESMPMTGANQCCTGLSPGTGTLVGAEDSTRGRGGGPPVLAATVAGAGGSTSP